MSRNRVLTGIKPTGTPHLGNCIGAIRPALQRSRDPEVDSFFFLADYHALIDCRDPQALSDSVRSTAASWLAMGLDPDKSLFYRQSDIPEIMELNWILSCLSAKGLLNRGHAYKAAVAANLERQESDPDRGISMGLFCYPVLMAADILMFDVHEVPVGPDQVQHVEMARDIAQRFNHCYGEHFVLPRATLPEAAQLLQGLDGRKMSKSYDNVIPLFASAEDLRRRIMKIRTNSQAVSEPKETEGCPLFGFYRAFAEPEARVAMERRYRDGIGWGEIKEQLVELLDSVLEEPRRRYQAIVADGAALNRHLNAGAERARDHARPFLQRLRKAVGMRAVA